LYAATVDESRRNIRSGILVNSHPTLGKREVSVTGEGTGLDGGVDKSMISVSGVVTMGPKFLKALRC